MNSLPFYSDKPIEVFFSYSHKDEAMRNELVKHLTLLKRNGIISYWYDRMVPAGSDWIKEVDKHLDTAQIILLLVSSDFLASEYCYSIEMKRAISRHENGKAIVIPIILRYVEWYDSLFGNLQPLPKNGKPVTAHTDVDEAFTEIVQGVREAIHTIVSKENSSDQLSELVHIQSEEKEFLINESKNVKNSVENDVMRIEITLNRDFYSYTEEEKRLLLEAIKKLLEIDSNIKVIRERRGSVKLTLELPPAQAEQLLSAVRGGKLKEFGVIGAVPVDPDWWKTLFDEVYLLTDAPFVNNPFLTSREVDTVEQALRLQPTHRILDLCGGHGRHALELARRGYSHLTVLDYTPFLLHLGRRDAVQEELPVTFCRGDARTSPFSTASFDVVLLMANSFGYFAEADDDQQVLAEVARVLAPGGRFLMDVTDHDYRTQHFVPESWHEATEDIVICWRREMEGNVIRVREMVISKSRGLIRDLGYAERLYPIKQLLLLLKEAGFTDAAVQPNAIVFSPEDATDYALMTHRMLVTAVKV